MNTSNTKLNTGNILRKRTSSLFRIKNTIGKGLIAGLMICGAFHSQTASAQYISSAASQNITTAMPGMTNAHILQVQVQATSGTLTSMTFNTSGTNNTANIASARLFYANGSSFSTALLASDQVGFFTAPNGSFTFNVNVNLINGANNFWLAYDLVNAAAVGDSVDAELVSMEVDATTQYPLVSAPAGSRLIVANGLYNYCPFPATNIANYLVGISRLTIGDTTINNVTVGAGNVQTRTNLIINMYKDVNYPISYKGSTGNGQVEKLYIDWNNDGFFDPVNEMVFSGTTPANTVNNNNIYIDCSRSNGIKRIRFATELNAGNCLPCGVSNGGNAFELMINVQDAPAAVANFTKQDTAYTNAFIDFKNNSNGVVLAMGYNYSWDYTNDGSVDATSVNGKFAFSSPGTVSTTLSMARTICGTPYSASVTKNTVIINPPGVPVSEFMASRNITTGILTVNLKDLSNNGANKWHWKITPETVNGAPAFIYVSGDSNAQNPSIMFLELGKYNVSLWTENMLGNGSYIIKYNYIDNIKNLDMCGVTKTTDAYGFLADAGGATGNYANVSNGLCSLLIQPCASSVSFNFLEFDMSSYQVTNCNIPGSNPPVLQPPDYVRIYDGVDATGIPLHVAAGFPNGFTNLPNNQPLPQLPPMVTAKSGSMYIEFFTNCGFNGTGFFGEWSSTPANVVQPVPSFTSDDTAYIGSPYVFTNTSTGIIEKYAWDYENNGVVDATTKDANITFTTPGHQTVKLLVERCGVQTSYVKNVRVLPITKAPVVDFRATRETAIVGDTLRLFDISQNGTTSWTWTITPSTGFTFVNSSNSNSKNPFIIFNQVGSYNVQLTAANSFGSDSKTKNSYLNIFAYCAPNVLNIGTDIGISRFKIGDIDNVSDIGVKNYTRYDLSTRVELGATYPIIIERKTNANNINRKVWIDFNKNGSFADQGEEVVYETSSNSVVFNGQITIPKTASLGTTRMRVGTSSENNNNFACGPNMFGEFEDYSLEIIKDITKPVITVLGDNPLRIELSAPFTDPGATAFDNSDGDITAQIVSYHNVNVNTMGQYLVVYKVTDSEGNVADSVTRLVIVDSDISGPEITLLTGDTLYHPVNTPFTDPGATAFDFADGNVTSSIVSSGTVDETRLGVYYRTYNAEDLSRNTTSKVRVVIVADLTAPVITVNGADPLIVDYKAPFVDPGTSVTDNFYTGLSAITSGYVNTSVMGPYLLTYTLTDPSGNMATFRNRQVIVKDISAPKLVLAGYDTATVNVFGTYTEQGVIITDNHTMNLTYSLSGSVNTNVVGVYELVYSATDSSGNIGTVKRYVKVVDRERPVMTLVGGEYITVLRFSNYVDAGVTIQDNYYTSAVLQGLKTVTSTVNTEKPGLYEYCYRLTDPSNNEAAQVCRLIQVDSITTSVKNSTLENGVELYPNPTAGKFTVRIYADLTEAVKIEVYNAHGALISVNNGTALNATYDINLDNQAAGVYYVKISSGNQNVSKKVTVVK